MSSKSHPVDVDKNINDLNIGNKIRALRREKELTLKTISKTTGLSVPLLSQIENNLVIPPISTLLKICNALNKDISFFFQKPAYEKKVAVVRVSERVNVDTRNIKSSRIYQSLAHNKINKCMEPFLIEIGKKDGKRIDLYSHRGEEFIFVIEGSIEFKTSEETYMLNAGDSIYFESDVPHFASAIGENNAKVLMVMYQP